MALTVSSSGTQTATIGTEHSLAAPSTGGFYALSVDMTNMAAGDLTTLRIKRKVLTGGTIRIVYEQVFADQQPIGDVVMVSVPMPCPYGVTVTLQQTAGTGRAYDWSLESW